MAVQLGSFFVPGTTGNLTVTGLAFEPVAVIFVASQAGLTSPAALSLGCATADDEQWSFNMWAHTQISGFTARGAVLKTDSCIQSIGGGGWDAELVSLNSDGFTVNFTDADPEAIRVSWLAIGGEHIRDAHAGTITTGGSTGETSVTDPGFLPSGLIVAHALTPDASTGDADFQAGVGVADGSLNQYSWWCRGVSGVNGQTQHIHRVDEVACGYDGSETFRMALASMDANGFTVDVTDAWTDDVLIGYLAIDGDGIVAGNGVTPDATGTQEHSTPSLEPGGVFFTWNAVDAPSTSGGSNVIIRPGAGLMTAAGDHAYNCVFRVSTPFNVFTADSYEATDHSVVVQGAGSGTGGTDNNSIERAELSAFDMGSFTLNWTQAQNGVNRAFGWLALPGEIPSPWIPQQYRRWPG